VVGVGREAVDDADAPGVDVGLGDGAVFELEGDGHAAEGVLPLEAALAAVVGEFVADFRESTRQDRGLREGEFVGAQLGPEEAREDAEADVGVAAVVRV
jgi:hypothetical protein